jgi:hypothetical protein
VSGFGFRWQVLLDLLLKELNPRIPDAREFAMNRRVLLAMTRGGTDVDAPVEAIVSVSPPEKIPAWTARSGEYLVSKFYW